ncbi:MAG: AbrB/MazE/SpoVT family DNA-binding domain-containing protein [Pseudomonadota bacterium]
MSDRVKIRKIGNSLGVVIPAEALSRLNVAEGDELLLTLTPNGYQLDVYDEEVAEQVKAGREIAKRYRNTLRELAK